jgi:hypothetical protein
MSPRILRRCSLCQKYHASYLVTDVNLGKLYLCYTCWKARQADQPPSATPTNSTPPRAAARIAIETAEALDTRLEN